MKYTLKEKGKDKKNILDIKDNKKKMYKNGISQDAVSYNIYRMRCCMSF